MPVRLINDQEWPIYKELRLRSLSDAPEAFCATLESALALNDEEWQQRVSVCHQRPRAPLFAIWDNSVCGLGLATLDESNQKLAHLFQLWVAPEFRQLGLGKALIQYAQDWARLKSAESLMLGIVVGNDQAGKLYESLGFTNIGETEPIPDRSPLVTQNMLYQL
ncbi:MAG: GNAT family N-acetyltransferase [Gammaproteobacteria bacterium]|nr:GNAT family N-acetyltransferase [Gammaproteobacteria bacterium]